MTTTRQQVMNNVVNLLKGITFSSPINGANSWRNPDVGQKLRLWSAVPADQQPAVFLVTHRETDEYRTLGLVRRRLELGIWCYSRSDNSIGADDLDTMMAALDTMLPIDNNSINACTFGGLVYWCRIEGRVFKDPGDVDGQTLLIVPIVVEMP